MSEKLFLRIPEVADSLGVSRATAYDLIARGQIPSVKLNGRGKRPILRVPAEALRRLANPPDAALEFPVLPKRGAR